MKAFDNKKYDQELQYLDEITYYYYYDENRQLVNINYEGGSEKTKLLAKEDFTPQEVETIKYCIDFWLSSNSTMNSFIDEEVYKEDNISLETIESINEKISKIDKTMDLLEIGDDNSINVYPEFVSNFDLKDFSKKAKSTTTDYFHELQYFKHSSPISFIKLSIAYHLEDRYDFDLWGDLMNDEMDLQNVFNDICAKIEKLYNDNKEECMFIPIKTIVERFRNIASEGQVDYEDITFEMLGLKSN